MTSQNIVPSLWFEKDADAAARFYASVFPDSRVDRVTALAAETPSGPAGSVQVVEFTLFGQSFMAMNAGPHDPFNDAVSFTVKCDSQQEIDRPRPRRPAACVRLDQRSLRRAVADRAAPARRVAGRS
jgi:predicted 3-demethylubiquinone-9 3-methyltransferase (glyoxalase superfamily)